MVFYGQTVDDIPDRGYVLFIIALVMVLIAAIFVGIRLTTRIYTTQLGWDDLFLTIGLVASTDLGESRNAAYMWFFIAQTPYKLALGSTKASIVLLYLRIFITQTFQRVGKVYLGVIGVWTVASVLVTILQCIPIQASWDKKIVNKACVDKNAWWYAFATINTATDFLIAILPIQPILHLNLAKRDKLGLLFVFGVGAL
ncbi:hypothetical protein N7462_011433 [Penicillium macrosclerotiorum]|uniref:uncharacterized protein n=1 Tax=Penicillium macrosclerotiorum TaxID=303699 RepID=UPI0025490556|nr:uncharacterized protein N7462_011433 [Penicillium macrosclerotiorum]KAJ5664620.1 hypothetical protein N7462_011433 [Penicillium macrosclerotiorum]